MKILKNLLGKIEYFSLDQIKILKKPFAINKFIELKYHIKNILYQVNRNGKNT